VRAVINALNLTDEEYINNNYVVMCTKKGVVKKTSLEAYSRPRQNGINAITIREDDTLLEARLTDGNHEIMIALRSGRAIRFNEKLVRPMGRNASGVRGIRLADEKDMVVGMICVDDLESNVLVVSENGYGKRSPVIDYRETNRGGKGVKTLNITEKTGQLIAIKNVIDSDDLLIINESGILIRIRISDIRVMGRATQGVKLINLRNNDIIAAVAVVPEDEEEDVEYESVVDEDDDTPIDPNIADDEDDDEDEEILEDEEDEIEDENETNEE
jgi:DNA gyrase subunit A